MKNIRKIELLSPAKDADTGIEAIIHGADAVYIGASRFGARAAAGNSTEDIKRLCDFAHIYNAKVYVTVNTIIKDKELAEVEKTIHDLYNAGVDALIVQDMAIMEMNLPPIELHASTQTDNRTVEKVRFLKEAGFSRVVLARELSLSQIRDIHEACDVELEVFIHGALCVSYSGQCYISQACFGRSANRGECAQFCRLPLTMTDADGKVIAKDRHLLSLKDLNQTDSLEELLDAGATSLKIEGRLKDMSYVKNITAHYRQKLDSIFKRRPEYTRASSGHCTYTFAPEPEKSFSRGFTSYFLHGRNNGIYSFDTPKSLGEKVGVMKEAGQKFIKIAGTKKLSNGDGICYLDENNELKGFRINKVEGNNVFPQEMPRIRKGTELFRNLDHEFEKALSRKSAERLISVSMELAENNFGYTLSAEDEDGNRVSVAFEQPKENARSPQQERIAKEIGKLGNTCFKAESVKISLDEERFIPASAISDARRKTVEKLLSARRINYRRNIARITKDNATPFPEQQTDYRGNVMNKLAEQFYREHNCEVTEPAYEASYVKGREVMHCKHCIKYAFGWCTREGKRDNRYKEPFYIETNNGKRFRLSFDCKACEMKVIDCN